MAKAPTLNAGDKAFVDLVKSGIEQTARKTILVNTKIGLETAAAKAAKQSSGSIAQ